MERNEPRQLDLLGDPRLKNGLAYYPGCSTKLRSAAVGNVVQLSLRTATDKEYMGFGYLKGDHS